MAKHNRGTDHQPQHAAGSQGHRDQAEARASREHEGRHRADGTGQTAQQRTGDAYRPNTNGR